MVARGGMAHRHGIPGAWRMRRGACDKLSRETRVPTD